MSDHIRAKQSGEGIEALAQRSPRPSFPESPEFIVRSKVGTLKLVGKAEIAPWEKYCNRINYSACNEDSFSELKALKLRPEDRVLCITAGGGRVLNLLLDRPAEIWAVDINLWQSHLLDLKIAALRMLDYDEYVAFLGLSAAGDRMKTFETITPVLADSSREFFRRRPDLIEKGILFQGNLERFFTLTARLMSVVWRRNRNRLFDFEDLDEQHGFLAKKWYSWRCRFLVETLTRKTLFDLFADDPGVTRFLPKGFPIHRRIYESIGSYLDNNLARDNSLLSLIFFRGYKFENAAPIYLQKRYFGQLKEALKETRIKIITGLIEEVLAEAPDGTFDAFSFSDIGSYMTDEVFGRHLDQVARTARPGARICARHFLRNRLLADPQACRIRRNEELECELALRDHAMVHRFLVGEIL
ncbi:MAG: DUF3419 family protein [Pseudomonadota bacterium]